MPIPLVSDKRRASSGEDNQYEQALPTHGVLSDFFDVTKNSASIFEASAIMKTEYASYINTYPTIFLSFADAKESKRRIVKSIKEQLLNVYDEYVVYRRIGAARPRRDTPFIEAHTQGFYKEVSGALSALLHTALKTSDDLQFAMLTGIQRVAKENTPKAGRGLFSDLNNLLVCTVKDKEYAEYFGFTKNEVKDLLAYYDLKYTDEVRALYDGYNMGGVDIFNPWSIINYAERKVLMPYWVNTSSNKMIKVAMKDCDASFKEGYEELIRIGTVRTLVNFETSFYELKETSSLWGLFAPQAGSA